MNYIQQFMNDNSLVVGQPFHISISPRLWFCFNADYTLDLLGKDEYIKSCTHFDYILWSLLAGNEHVTFAAGNQ